jgi:hypothetical protein
LNSVAVKQLDGLVVYDDAHGVRPAVLGRNTATDYSQIGLVKCQSAIFLSNLIHIKNRFNKKTLFNGDTQG